MSMIAKLQADWAKVKAAVTKAVSEVDGVIVPESEVLEPLIAQVAEAVIPGGGAVAQIGENVLLAIAKVIDAGGSAAESNLANAGLDVTLIQDVKGLIPSLKAASKG